ncbi:MAG: DUF4384 domain-containing protein [Cyclobacteriaceae bacterium]|nr:DUF4384 domain-containing protein [Cyclobacteriaceae bacterium]
MNKLLGRIIFILPFFCCYIQAFSQEKEKGVLISDFEYSKVEKRYFSVRGGTRVLPSEHSLKKYAPKPLNQFDYPTSPAWASSYAALTIVEAQQSDRTGKENTEKAFSPLFPYYYSTKGSNNADCNQLVSVAQILKAMKEYGTPRYVDYPVRCATRSPQKMINLAARNKISEYSRLFDTSDSDATKLDAIKTTIADDLPVVVVMNVDKSFNYAKEFWRPREAFNTDLPGQALCVVGYDDNKYGGAVEVMNSRGSEWGNKGFMWIPYEDFITYTRQAFSLYMIPPKNSTSELSGGIQLEIANGAGNMELQQIRPGYYKIKNSYPSGTLFKIKVINHSSGFLYVFASDLTGEIFDLFPPDLTSAAFSSEASFYVPNETTQIEIDDTIGTDYLCVLFSKEGLDVSTVYNQIKAAKGTFEEKVRQALKDKLIPTNQINFKFSEADFLVRETNKSIVALIIEHDHQ